MSGLGPSHPQRFVSKNGAGGGLCTLLVLTTLSPSLSVLPVLSGFDTAVLSYLFVERKMSMVGVAQEFFKQAELEELLLQSYPALTQRLKHILSNFLPNVVAIHATNDTERLTMCKACSFISPSFILLESQRYA